MLDLLKTAAALINSGDIGFTGPKTDSGVLSGILNAVYFWAGAVAVIVIVVAGFMYTTSAGDPNQTKKAKDAILGASIGLVIVLLAFTITAFVTGALG